MPPISLAWQLRNCNKVIDEKVANAMILVLLPHPDARGGSKQLEVPYYMERGAGVLLDIEAPLP